MITDWAESLDGITDQRLVWLAAMVSLPPLAPFPLIRRVRRAGLGPNTLHLEAELCESAVVAAVAFDGIELEHDFRARARDVLRTFVLEGELDAEELRRVTRVDDLGLSPLLELEENLAWIYVSQENPGPEADRLLTDCLLSVVREERERILDWAAGALNRLPGRILRTPAAWLLSELCIATRRQVFRVLAPDLDQVDGDLLSEVSRLLPTVLIGLERDGRTLSLGPITRSRRIAVPVPAIMRQPVTVVWSGPGGREQVTVNLGDRSVVELPVGAGPVRLRTVAGRVFTLAPISPGEPAPEIADLDAILDTIEQAWLTSRAVSAEVTRLISPRTAVVSLSGAKGLPALLRTVLADENDDWSSILVPGLKLDVRISNFDRPWQRIVCRPATRPPWMGAELEVDAEIEGRYTHGTDYGMFVQLPTSPLGWDGPVVSGLVHNSNYPGSWRTWPPVLSPGDPLRVRILSIDLERRRISLAAFDDRPDPLLSLSVGDVMDARLNHIVHYGVFVTLLSGLQALLHRSEIPADAHLEPGMSMRVRILQIDQERRRVVLATEPRLPPGAASLAPMPAKQSVHVVRQHSNEFSVAETVDAAEVTDFILEKLREPGLTNVANLGSQVTKRFGSGLHNGGEKWLGMGTFTKLLKTLIPGIRISGFHAQLPES
ncbi:S1 RNA-binding domain-containing protein [Lentzea sp. DG1S-22]|uniref:S1 RNA-binding domain-containing protein n=1 Tax=Lentzea sp. DG1S-22 TaxID=3108822 RepID=UPI002E796DDD|nr:S1 RNA-binding domain-containing protein [Lentzea sp. DG1S-22]WVH82492.1 S1 RNA-binding domain-containing protein [Lentzea sp. DG1S-22]